MESLKALSKQALRTEKQPISYLLSLALERKGLVSLAAGFVDYETLPVEEVRTALEDIFSDPASGRAALQYGTTAGHPALREALLNRLAKMEGTTPEALSLTPDDVIVTSGSQQLLFLLSSILVDPGDVVLLPRPAYYVYMGTLQAVGARAAGIDTDDDGLRADLLDRRLSELEESGLLGRVKLLYVCTYSDNPRGVTMSAQRRREVVEVVRRWRRKQHFYILEDAACRELYYSPEANVAPMKTLDAENDLVILTQSFSKSMAPGLRTGYGFIPKGLMPALLDQKGTHDFGSCNLSQHIAYRLLKSGVADRHAAELRESCKVKADALLDALEEHFGPLRAAGVSWLKPSGGLYAWMTLPESVNTDLDGSLFRRCLDGGVIYVPGSCAYLKEEGFPIPRNHIRLSFLVPSVQETREGVRRLAEAVRKELA